MSQIRIDARVSGVSVPVLLGWDRPLQRSFFVVDCLDNEEACSASLVKVLAELEALTLGVTHPQELRELVASRVTLPDAVWDELSRHHQQNVGNLIVVFDEAGEELSRTLC